MIMIEDTQKTEEQQITSVLEVEDSEELRELISKLPDGTIYSISLGVIKLGQET